MRGARRLPALAPDDRGETVWVDGVNAEIEQSDIKPFSCMCIKVRHKFNRYSCGQELIVCTRRQNASTAASVRCLIQETQGQLKISSFCFREDIGLNYPFFKVASVAQIKSDHFNDCEEDHPSYEQSLVVSRKINELEVKQNWNVRMTGRYENIF